MCIKYVKDAHKTDIEMKKHKLKSSIINVIIRQDILKKPIWTVQALLE